MAKGKLITTQSGNSVIVLKSGCVIKKHKMSVNIKFKPIGKLFLVKFGLGNVKECHVADDKLLRHRRLDHHAKEYLKKFGLPFTENICGTCIVGKFERLHFQDLP